MNNSVFDQMVAWTVKKMTYQHKVEALQGRLERLMSQRKEIDALPVGNITAPKYYKQLDALYTQQASLPAKIRKCSDHINTLSICLWS